MSTPGRRRLGALAVAAMLVVGVPLLSGCAVVEGLIEQQTGGDIDLGGASVPDGFPAEVPLIDGQIVNGSSATGQNGEQVWNVLINVAAADAPTRIAAQLEGAGFTSPGSVGGITDQGGTLTYTQGALVVNVLLAKVGDGWTANYTVARPAS